MKHKVRIKAIQGHKRKRNIRNNKKVKKPKGFKNNKKYYHSLKECYNKYKK